MKKYLLPLVIVMILSLCFGDLLNAEGSLIVKTIKILTEGNTAFSVRTATYNGPYGPRNAGVIWITNSQNQFVKTVKIWASNYRYTLIRWINNSSQNTSGAITSASLNSHQLHNITWNGKDYLGNNVPDGDYKINIEFTEHNASASNMGKYKQVTFTKGTEPVNLTIPNEAYFKDMVLTWTPVVVNGTLSGTVLGTNSLPISGAVIAAGSYSVFSGADGSYSLSLTPGAWDVSCVVDGYVPQILNGITITSAQVTNLNFNLAAVSNSDELNPSAQFIILNASPNPFSSQTSLFVKGHVTGNITAGVFDLKGRKIRNLASRDGSLLNWDGKDNQGRSCPNGVYFIKVLAGKQITSCKVVLKK
ncbi:MAG: DUF2271 domain-containing protein [Candidatus Cloacimonetes bacterium]|nr:DUF2271 domain-containing protein [Candidatus Cloacimonadota bacterium]